MCALVTSFGSMILTKAAAAGFAAKWEEVVVIAGEELAGAANREHLLIHGRKALRLARSW